MLKHNKLCIAAILLAACLSVTQSASAKLPIGALLHHPPMGHGLGLGAHPFKNFNIPKPPASENPIMPIKHNFQVMDNMYKMDNKIVDASPGILGGGALLRHQQQQAQTNSAYSNNGALAP